VPSGYAAVAWDGWLPGELQALLAPDRDADGVLVVRISIGWCPAKDSLTEANGVLCVRSPETSLGSGPPGAIGYLFLKRLDLPGSAISAKRPTTVVKRYAYSRLADTIYGDRPILGSGETRQQQAEEAAAQAARSLLLAATRPPK